jgi:hypothetical protein
MSMVHAVDSPKAGWLRGQAFDLTLICGITGIALVAASLIAVAPALAGLIFLIDSWFLGYPHVIATFVRLAPDRASIIRHRFLIFVLPLIVLAVTLGLTIAAGIGLVITIYFYWQWYHTLRQSWGIAQLYRRRSAVPVREHPKFAEGLFILVALWGLLHRLSAGLDFFGLPIYTQYVPIWLAQGVGGLALAGLTWWAASRIREWIAGELPVAHTLFSASHYLIFIVGYVLLDDVGGGWVVTNIWHTAQYLMIVWLFNQNMVAKSAGAATGWYFQLTRNNSAALFFTLCLVGALPIYFALHTADLWLGSTVILATIVLNQVINFHHFIVDAVIWRKRGNPAGAPA